MDEPANERSCNCGSPAKWHNNPHLPIEFDAEMNEYHLVKDGARAVMRYCFRCGGWLPESKRGTFFTEPDEAEIQEILLLLANATSLEDVFRILGPPDATLELGGGEYRPDGAIRWDKIHRYSTRWKSLQLDIPDLPDGHRHFIIQGHYLGMPGIGDHQSSSVEP